MDSSRGRRSRGRHPHSSHSFRGGSSRSEFRLTPDTNVRGRNSYPPTQSRDRGSGREVHFANSNRDRNFRGAGQRSRPNRIRSVRGRTGERQPPDPESQWFRVEVPHGESAGKDFLFRGLNGSLDTPLVPYNYHTEGTSVIFYVIGNDMADTLRSLSRRITKPDGFKIIINVKPSTAPQSDIDDRLLQLIREVMSKRFAADLNYLDLSNFRKDETFTSQSLYVPLDRPAVLKEVVKVIQQNIPHLSILNFADNRIKFLESLSPLKTCCGALRAVNLSNNLINNVTELDQLKGVELDELWIKGNPCQSNARDQSSLISAIRSVFPKLTKLDGETLPAAIGFDVGEEKTTVPYPKDSHIPEVTKSFVQDFLKAFYDIFDSDDRQNLVAAYHDQASFSFSISKPADNQIIQKAQFPTDLLQESRNLLRIKDSTRNKLLKQGKINIVAALSNLPATQHIRDSFLIDVPIFSDQLFVLVVNGVVIETWKRSKQVRSFCRSFTIVPQGGGFVITNDMLQMANSSYDQRTKYRSLTNTGGDEMPVELSAPVPNPMAMDVLVKRLQQSSGMNENFSRQCLAENSYVFEKALEMFNDLNSRGAIPAEAFAQ